MSKENKMSKEEVDLKLRLIEVLVLIAGLLLAFNQYLFGNTAAGLSVEVFPISFLVAALVYYILISQEQFRYVIFESSDIFAGVNISKQLSQILIVALCAICLSITISMDIAISGRSLILFIAYTILLGIFTFFGLLSNSLTKNILYGPQIKLSNSIRRFKYNKIQSEEKEKLLVIIKKRTKDILSYINFIQEGNLPKAQDIKELLKAPVHWWNILALQTNLLGGINLKKLGGKTNSEISTFIKCINRRYPEFLEAYIALYDKLESSALIKNSDRFRANVYLTGIFLVILGYENKTGFWPNYHESIKLDGKLDDILKIGLEYRNNSLGKRFLKLKKGLLNAVNQIGNL